MAVAVRVGLNWLAESVAPHARWVENPGECALFVDSAAATAYATARNITFVMMQPVVSGRKNSGKKTNDD